MEPLQELDTHYKNGDATALVGLADRFSRDGNDEMRLKTCLRLSVLASASDEDNQVLNRHIDELATKRKGDSTSWVFDSLDDDAAFADSLVPGDWTRYRGTAARMVARVWAGARKALDEELDDPLEDASYNLVPPEATGLPSGVDPKAIKDPKLRLQYEEAIDANRKKLNLRSQHYVAREKLHRFSEAAEKRLKQLYSRRPDAVEELTGLVDPDVFGRETVESLVTTVRLNLAQRKNNQDQ